MVSSSGATVQVIDEISTGVNGVYLCQMGGQKFVRKESSLVNKPRRLSDHLIPTDLSNSVRWLNYRISTNDPLEVMNLERRVLTNWNSAGITAPQVIGFTESALDISFIDGLDFPSVIKSGNLDSNAVSSLINLIGQIRGLAFQKRDPFFLHNDMHLYNFLLEDGINAVPIDPGLPFDESLSLEDLDASFNLYMAYSILSDLDRSDKKTEYLYIHDEFLQSLQPFTLRKMRSLHSPLNFSLNAYLGLLSNLGIRDAFCKFAKSFNRENYNLINSQIGFVLKDKEETLRSDVSRLRVGDLEYVL